MTACVNVVWGLSVGLSVGSVRSGVESGVEGGVEGGVGVYMEGDMWSLSGVVWRVVGGVVWMETSVGYMRGGNRWLGGECIHTYT